jgi:hypothetical protein
MAVLFVWGCVELVKRRQWWVLCLLSYFLIPWLQWGIRLKPRYMAPIAPMLFIALWLGVTGMVEIFWKRPSIGVITLRVMLGLLLAVNGVAWGVEFYVRHASRLNFYDVARRGAYAELVDIGAYLQTAPDSRKAARDPSVRSSAPVWLNDPAGRRIVYFLSGRRTEIPIAKAGDRFWEVHVRPWADMSAEPKPDEPAAKDMERFFSRISRHDPWALVYCEPKPWPEFHLPLRHEANQESESFWRLYHREPDGRFHRVIVPPQDRSYVDKVPRSGL